MCLALWLKLLERVTENERHWGSVLKRSGNPQCQGTSLFVFCLFLVSTLILLSPDNCRKLAHDLEMLSHHTMVFYFYSKGSLQKSISLSAWISLFFFLLFFLKIIFWLLKKRSSIAKNGLICLVLCLHPSGVGITDMCQYTRSMVGTLTHLLWLTFWRSQEKVKINPRVREGHTRLLHFGLQACLGEISMVSHSVLCCIKGICRTCPVSDEEWRTEALRENGEVLWW